MGATLPGEKTTSPYTLDQDAAPVARGQPCPCDHLQELERFMWPSRGDPGVHRLCTNCATSTKHISVLGAASTGFGRGRETVPREHGDGMPSPSDSKQVSDEIEAFQCTLVAKHGRSASTAKTYARYVQRFAEWLPYIEPGMALNEVTPWVLGRYLGSMSTRGVSPSTVRGTVVALRAYYNVSIEQGRSCSNPATAIRLPRRPVPKPTFGYSQAEVHAVLERARQRVAAADSDHEELRAWVAYVTIAVLRFAGPRAGELCELRIVDINLDSGHVSIGSSPQRGRGRSVPIPSELVEILQVYLQTICPLLPTSPFLLANPSSRLGSPNHGSLTTEAVRQILARIARECELEGDRHGCHRWRVTYATTLLQRRLDVETLRAALGLNDVATVVDYLRQVDDGDAKSRVQRAWSTSGIDAGHDNGAQHER